LEKQPGSLQIRLLLADCYFQYDEHSKVIELLRQTADEHPENMAANFMLGTAYFKTDRPAEGERVIARLLKDPGSAEAHLVMATAYVQGKMHQPSMDEYRKTIALNPQLPKAHAGLAREYLRDGDFSLALAEYEKELSINPNDFDAHLHAGYIKRRQKDFEGARANLTKALQLRPHEGAAAFQLAMIHFQTEEWDAAQKQLEEIVRREPEFVDAHVFLAQVYYRKQMRAEGETEQALAEKLKAAYQERIPPNKSSDVIQPEAVDQQKR